ncbi:MAG: class D sortase [Firmicutes bacterium]|nr:class D sortase [Bacillota bacterium]
MKKVANVLIVIGMLVFFYPLLDRAFTWYWQQRIFNEWKESLAMEDLSPDESDHVSTEIAEEPTEDVDLSDSFLGLDIIPLGILEIEKIDLKIPVLKGANLANLKIGAGLLEDTAMIGAPGNTVLTAHRSYTYGRFFNRLDEIDIGDEIIITTQEKIYRYVVYNKVIVKPAKIPMNAEDMEKDILTLVTCHPIRVATHRLVVQATVEQEAVI